VPIFPISPTGDLQALASSAGVVLSPQFWAGSPGYRYFIGNPHADLVAAASATNQAGLDGWGWTCTGLAVTEGSGADFGSLADIDPTRIVLADASDLLLSPRIFGGYEGFLAAKQFLGEMPTELRLRFFANFAVNSTNENTTFVGLGRGANSAASCGGAIRVNATVFLLENDGGTSLGPAKDTSWHEFDIRYKLSGGIDWYIDETYVGNIASPVVDIWPVSLIARSNANDIGFSHGELEYRVMS